MEKLGCRRYAANGFAVRRRTCGGVTILNLTLSFRPMAILPRPPVGRISESCIVDNANGNTRRQASSTRSECCLVRWRCQQQACHASLNKKSSFIYNYILFFLNIAR